MIKRVIILFVIFSMCFCSIAFADDLEPDTSGSSPSADDRLATEEEIQSLDSAISETSHNIALLMASGDPVRATDYEQATYNLLSSIFGSSSSSWASIVATRLGYLSTINTSANSLVVKLTGFYNSINPDYDTTGISMYDVAHGILTALTTIDPNDGDLTIIETLVYIHTALEDLDTDLTAILNSTYSIDTKLVNINTAIVQFKSDLMSSISTLNTDINTGFTNVNANMQIMINNLTTLNNNLNYLSWSNGITVGAYSSTDDLISNNPLTSQNWINNIIYRFKINSPDASGAYPIYAHFRLPSSSLNNIDYPSFDFSYINGSNVLTDFKPLYYLVVNRFYYDLYVYLDSSSFNKTSSSYDIVITINARTWYFINGSLVQFLSYDNIDFYIFDNYFNNQLQYKILNKFEYLYASDDLIESKEAQQPLEDQIISDFTGNGSASATVGDAINIKQASNAIKNGLNTGANSGVALDYAFGFNNPYGLFVWFSSDTAQYFTLYQPTRGIPNYCDIEWTDDLPDHLSVLDYKYQQGLNND